jgi:hypothetical protein
MVESCRRLPFTTRQWTARPVGRDDGQCCPSRGSLRHDKGDHVSLLGTLDQGEVAETVDSACLDIRHKDFHGAQFVNCRPFGTHHELVRSARFAIGLQAKRCS